MYSAFDHWAYWSQMLTVISMFLPCTQWVFGPLSPVPALRPIEYECDRPVILAVDSCMNGVGFILLQLGEDKKRYPSRFGSITFNDRESRYSQAKLELYGLFRALKQTQLFMIGVKKLIIEMDAKFIKGMLNNPTLHPNDAINRWIAAILLFDFELVHVPAEKHTGADGLSRRPHATNDPQTDNPKELEDWIDSNSGFFIETHSPPSPYDPAPSLSIVLHASSPPPSSPPESPKPDHPTTIPRSAKAIECDRKLEVVRQFLETQKRPSDFSDEKYRQFIRQATGYFIMNGKLFRKNHDSGPQLVPNPEDTGDKYRFTDQVNVE